MKPVSKKKAKDKRKTFSVTLSEKEGELLRVYAKQRGITRPQAIRRLACEALRASDIVLPDKQPKNQLSLFDAVQVNIFEE